MASDDGQSGRHFEGPLPRIVAVALQVSVHQAWVRISVDGDWLAVEHDLGSYEGGGMYYKRRYATRPEAERRGDQIIGDESGQGAWVTGDTVAPTRV